MLFPLHEVTRITGHTAPGQRWDHMWLPILCAMVSFSPLAIGPDVAIKPDQWARKFRESPHPWSAVELARRLLVKLWEEAEN